LKIEVVVVAATTAGGLTRGDAKMTGGPITAAVMFLIILAALIVYGSGVQL
jgi:hypothetical protein